MPVSSSFRIVGKLELGFPDSPSRRLKHNYQFDEDQHLKGNQMRKLIYEINISLDGCCDHTKMSGGDEILEHFTHLMQDADLFVYGRKTYQLMVPYWPDAARDQSATKMTKEFAQRFDSVPKIVFSRSLDSVEDKNSRIARGKLQDEILKLKQEQGKKYSSR